MTRVAFVVNGPPAGPMGERGRAIAGRLQARHDVRLFYRGAGKVLSIGVLATELTRFGPDVCYVLDMAYSGVAAGALYRGLTGAALIVDTGDAITALARSMGRGRAGMALTAALEQFSLRAADRIVVRGSYHRDWLARRGIRAEVIPDGVEPDQFAPRPDSGLRQQLGLAGVLTLGLVGSSLWSERLQTCYGWDLIEMVWRLRDRPVCGVMIGDGSGIAVLRQRCRTYGIEDRVRFLGRLPYDQLPAHLGVLDVCLSTQTNDLVGRVRTTGKLPLYMAAGRYILASDVGEASVVLDPEMRVEFAGQHDPEYPAKLAKRVGRLLTEPERLKRGLDLIRRARERFAYAVLAERVERLILEATGVRYRTVPSYCRA
jgi:glycosyltransferase involved in cell wall biosynthesis